MSKVSLWGSSTKWAWIVIYDVSLILRESMSKNTYGLLDIWKKKPPSSFTGHASPGFTHSYAMLRTLGEDAVHFQGITPFYL